MNIKKIRMCLSVGISILLLTACPNTPEYEHEVLLEHVAQTYKQDLVLPSDASEQVISLNHLASEISTIDFSASSLNVELLAYSSGSPHIKVRSTNNMERIERNCLITITAYSGDIVILSIIQRGVLEGTDIDDLHNSQTNKPAYQHR